MRSPRLNVVKKPAISAHASPHPPSTPPVPIGLAATMVLHHLAGRFAVSSSELRKAPPFRRRGENRDKPALFGRHSDTGHVAVSPVHRQHRSVAEGTLRPRVLVRAFDDGALPPEARDEDDALSTSAAHHRPDPRRSPSHVLAGDPARGRGDQRRDTRLPDQRRRPLGTTHHERHVVGQQGAQGVRAGCKGYARQRHADGADADELRRRPRCADQVTGHSDREKRNNTCVGPGFACGLNPTVPDAMLRRFPSRPRPCKFGVSGEIALQWAAAALGTWTARVPDREGARCAGQQRPHPGVRARADRVVAAAANGGERVLHPGTRSDHRRLAGGEGVQLRLLHHPLGQGRQEHRPARSEERRRRCVIDQRAVDVPARRPGRLHDGRRGIRCAEHSSQGR
jgi:hypothetical protein